MKGKAKTTMAIAAGYLLGRDRKLRTATTTAIAVAMGGKSSTVRKGARRLSNSSVLGKVIPLPLRKLLRRAA
jgi:hypothetical protein